MARCAEKYQLQLDERLLKKFIKRQYVPRTAKNAKPSMALIRSIYEVGPVYPNPHTQTQSRIPKPRAAYPDSHTRTRTHIPEPSYPNPDPHTQTQTRIPGLAYPGPDPHTRTHIPIRICYTRYSYGRRCVTCMSHPSLTWQAVCYVYVTPVT
jgi:hypothetical protein